MNKLQWHFNRNCNIFFQENAFESVVCEMATILSRPQCVNGVQMARHVAKMFNSKRPFGNTRRHTYTIFPQAMAKCLTVPTRIGTNIDLSLVRSCGTLTRVILHQVCTVTFSIMGLRIILKKHFHISLPTKSLNDVHFPLYYTYT